MSFDAKTLYELLPAIYRIRDTEEGEPLKALLKVIAQQAGVLEENLAQLYDDQFAETCAPWVLPYIGDLVGITGLPSSSSPILTPRAEVARTIGYRRRKGPAATLEQLARDVSGWPARAVEFFQLIAATQYMNHLRPENQSFVSVRGAERLEYLGSAFEHLANGGADLTHTVDVRRISSGRGRYNIPNVGLFLWRLRSFSLTRSPAVRAPGGSQRQYLFSPLGVDLPLFNLPLTEDEITHLAEPVNVPDRIRRRVLARNFDDYYGRGKSFLLERGNPDLTIEPVEISPDDIIVCDLTDWTNMPTNKIAIDPVLGRIAFPQDEKDELLVTFHYGFSANMGGGEYNRFGSLDTARRVVIDAQGQPVIQKVVNTYFEASDAGQSVVPETTINSALAKLGAKGGTVEILNSGRYEEDLSIDATDKFVELRAADKRRPTLVLTQDIQISGGSEDEVVLDGLLIVGGGLEVKVSDQLGQLGHLRLRHCTLVPGVSLDPDGTPSQPNVPSLIVRSANTRVTIDHCILGSIQSVEDAEITIKDSIIDATDETLLAYSGIANSIVDGPDEKALAYEGTKDNIGKVKDKKVLASGGTNRFGAPLRITNSTVIGRVRTSIMRLASNTIFLASFANETDKTTLIAPVLAERRQEGCVRFSYLSPGARVPTRYHCQPEPDDSYVRPQFVSTRFRDPAYCQLSAFCPCEIRRGADDEAEMGAFHDLFQPQREAHLRTRLDEYLRFGLEAGIFYAT